MSEEEQKYFKGLIGFTFDSDDIRYIEKMVNKKNEEIKRLNNIIEYAIEYINKNTINSDFYECFDGNIDDLLEILKGE